MLPLALCLFQKPDVAETFIEECRRAVLEVKEGTWGFEVASKQEKDEKHVRQIWLRKDGEERMTVSEDGKPRYDVYVGPTSAIGVYPDVRQYWTKTYPASEGEGEPEPLPPIEEGSFDFKVVSRLGFVLRANPPFSEAKTWKTEGRESLEVVARKPDGGTLVATLVRDGRTRLPLTLHIVASSGTTDVRFLFARRKVDLRELRIDPASYQGFEKVEPSAPTGGASARSTATTSWTA